jgi:hypothetical protein
MPYSDIKLDALSDEINFSTDVIDKNDISS